MLLVPSESGPAPKSQPHCTSHCPEKTFELPETCWGITVPELRITTVPEPESSPVDRKSTRLNSSHEWISYAVFCSLPLQPTLFPYTTLFRSEPVVEWIDGNVVGSE